MFITLSIAMALVSQASYEPVPTPNLRAHLHVSRMLSSAAVFGPGDACTRDIELTAVTESTTLGATFLLEPGRAEIRTIFYLQGFHRPSIQEAIR